MRELPRTDRQCRVSPDALHQDRPILTWPRTHRRAFVGVMLLCLAPDELTPAAESALVHRLLEDGENPHAWTVLAVWASGEREHPAHLLGRRGTVSLTPGLAPADATPNGRPASGWWECLDGTGLGLDLNRWARARHFQQPLLFAHQKRSAATTQCGPAVVDTGFSPRTEGRQ